jgi:hypothetical protein
MCLFIFVPYNIEMKQVINTVVILTIHNAEANISLLQCSAIVVPAKQCLGISLYLQFLYWFLAAIWAWATSFIM